MHRTAGNIRTTLLVLFASAVVFAFAPVASAQMKGGGGLGGGGGSGGKGGSRDKEKKPRPKRNEIPQAEPAAAREKLQAALVTALSRGTASAPFIANLFDQASTGAVPASVQSRKALAEALATPLKGKKLDEAQATAIAENVTVFVNADGVTPEDLSAKKDPLKEALGTAGLSDDQLLAVLAATDKLVADQQDETVKKFMDELEEVQKEGEAGEDRKKALGEHVTALASGELKPDETSVAKLAENLVKGADAAQLTNKEKAQLAYDIRTVVNTPAMPPAQLMPVLNEVKTILKAGLVKGAQIQAIASELQAMNKSLAAAAAAAPATAPAEGDAPAAGGVPGEK
jgi:hypothetical protein